MSLTHLTAEGIRAHLGQQPPQTLSFHTGSLLRRAAVLMPLVHNGGWHLLFTRRTQMVQDHKGQVSFPGGAVDPQDQSCENTALREAYEEIGLPSERVELLGRMPQMRTITGYLVTPVVGIVPWPFDLRLSEDEVERVFTIPLDWLANPENHEEKWMVLRNARQDRVIVFRPYDGEVLWGITARLTVDFLGLVNKIQ